MIGAAKVIAKIEQAGKIGRSQLAVEMRLLEQNIFQRPICGDGFPGSCLDEHVSRHFTHAVGQGESDGFGEDQSSGSLEVAEHPFRMHFEPWQHFGEMMKRARGDAEQFRKSLPFRLPTTQTPLEFLRRGRQDGGDKAWGSGGGGNHHCAGDGIAFMRQGGRSSTAVGGWLRQFVNFRLCVQGNVAADFAQSAGQRAEKAGQLSHPVAVRVPGNGRQRQLKFTGKVRGDRRTPLSQRGQGSRGATELQRQDARLEFSEASTMAENGVEPTRGDGPERGGRGVLHPGPRDHRR